MEFATWDRDRFTFTRMTVDPFGGTVKEHPRPFLQVEHLDEGTNRVVVFPLTGDEREIGVFPESEPVTVGAYQSSAFVRVGGREVAELMSDACMRCGAWSFFIHSNYWCVKCNGGRGHKCGDASCWLCVPSCKP